MYHHFATYYNQIFSFNQQLSYDLKPFIKRDGKAIDLGCGTGRLVALLETLKMKAIGVDMDQSMIDVAKKDYPNLTFYQANMVDFLDNDSSSYDLMTCFGNTLPHLSKDDLVHFLVSAKKRLNQDGYLIIQMLNYNKILKYRPTQLKPLIFNGGLFERFYTYHETFVTFKTVLSIADHKTTDETKLYPYTKEVLSEVLDDVGFNYKFQKSLSEPLDDEADHITIICQ